MWGAWTKQLIHQSEQLPARVTLSSARLLSSACPPGTQTLGPASSGHRGVLLSLDGAAHPGCHSRHTPWILDPHCGRTRQTRGTTHPSGQGFTSHCTKYTRLTARRTHRQTWLRQGPEEPASPPVSPGSSSPAPRTKPVHPAHLFPQHPLSPTRTQELKARRNQIPASWAGLRVRLGLSKL